MGTLSFRGGRRGGSALVLLTAVASAAAFPAGAMAQETASTGPAQNVPGTQTAVEPPAAASAPEPTSAAGGKMIDFNNKLQTIHAYWVTPSGTGPWPGVVLVHDIFGLTRYAKQEANDLAAQGYAVLVPDLYSRDNVPNGVGNPSAAAEAYSHMSDDQAVNDLRAGLDFIANDPNVAGQPLGIVGLDMGGIYAFLLGSQDVRVKAIVDYYGKIRYANTSALRPQSPFEMAFNLNAPLLAFYGDRDPQNTPSQVDEFESRLKANPNHAYFNLVRYPGVGHGFEKPGRQGYDPVAAADAKKLTRSFLEKTLKAPAAPAASQPAP